MTGAAAWWPDSTAASGVAASSTRELAWVVRVTSAAFLVTLVLSWRLYIHELRIFLITPVVEALAATPAPVEWILYAAHAACLALLLLRPLQRLPALGVLLCTGFWVLQDLLRLQPYLTMYAFTLLIVAIRGTTVEGALNALRIMVCSVYFWAGFHKLNATFVLVTFPWFIEPFYTPAATPSLFDKALGAAVFAVPVFELLIGVLLLFPRFWRLASAMALVMLIVVLLCLGPLGRNWNMIVWPWNIYLFLLEIILFYRPALRHVRAPMRINPAGALSLALFGIAPLFAAFGLWHSYPGLKLYSGNIDSADVVFADGEEFSRVPPSLDQLVAADGTLSLIDWTERELNTIVYPEERVFRRGARGLCPYLDRPEETRLRIWAAPPFNAVAQRYVEVPLCGE